MLKKILFLLLVFSFTRLFGQEKYRGLPVVQADSPVAGFRVNDIWYQNAWNIVPSVPLDSLKITCYFNHQTFTFITDKDSISFFLKPGDERRFYVKWKDQYALTLVKAMPLKKREPLVFDSLRHQDFHFCYLDSLSPYLDSLRKSFRLDTLVAGVSNEKQKVLNVLHWVHTRWKHNGNNVPDKQDAISILNEAKRGKNFRCVEYGVVLSESLKALGFKARVLGLKTKDVETRQYGAGHVVTEVFLNDRHKWVFVDAQWDVMPVLDGIPLNGVEFQRAIALNLNRLTLASGSNVNKYFYTEWVFPYLFYFDTSFGQSGKECAVDGKTSLMLVPKGAKNPTVFQIKYPMNDYLYTHSVMDFYLAPSTLKNQ